MQVLNRLKTELPNQECFTDKKYIQFLWNNLFKVPSGALEHWNLINKRICDRIIW